MKGKRHAKKLKIYALLHADITPGLTNMRSSVTRIVSVTQFNEHSHKGLQNTIWQINILLSNECTNIYFVDAIKIIKYLKMLDMFRITEDPSSWSLVLSTWLKLQEWFYRVRWHGRVRCYGSIFWPAVCVCSSALSVDSAFLYSELHTHTQRVRICCHNTDHVHVNGHDRTNFSQALYKAPWWWIFCYPKHVGASLIIYNFNCIYELYICA